MSPGGRIRILIGGDVCPTSRDLPMFTQKDTPGLFHDVLDVSGRSDYFLVNLECPLIERPSPIDKSGMVLGAPSSAAVGLKSAGIHAVNIGNNHIMDHGVQGLENTVKALDLHGIAYVGAGLTIEQAREPLIIAQSGIRAAVLSMADREYGTATRKKAGANPISSIEFIRWVRRYRDRYDHLIVLLHTGKESYEYPSPRGQDFCRFLIEEGACAVICQHSHCPGVYENYRNGFISYGQGNFLFDPFPDRRPWLYVGYLVDISIDSNRSVSFDLIPVMQSDLHSGVLKGVSLQPEKDATRFLKELGQNSEKLKDRDFIESNWADLSRQFKEIYFSVLRGHHRALRRLNRITSFSDLFYNRKRLLELYNIVRCETLQELLETILDRAAFGKQERE